MGAILLALILLVFVEPVLQTYQKFLYILIAVFSGLLPDVDHAKSYMGRKVKIIGWLFKHRGFFHSLLFGIIIIIIGFKIIPTYKWALIGGYASHLILDALTHQGEQFLWPTKIKLKGLIKTGGIIEIVIFILLVVVDAYLFLFL